MTADESSESAWNNFGNFIHQLLSETKTLIRKPERNLIKLYRQNVSCLFNIYIYIYICMRMLIFISNL